MKDTGEVIRKNFQISNNQEGFKKLLHYIDEAKKLFNDDVVKIGLESTGVYSIAITGFLADVYKDSVILINPVLTSMFQLSHQVHYAKTDKQDALDICKFLSKNQDIRPYTRVSYHTKRLRALYRERIKLNKRLNQDMNRLNGIVHYTSPEFIEKYPTFGKTELEFLFKYPSAYSLKKLTTKKLLKSFSKLKYMHLTENKAKELIELAKHSIATTEEDGFSAQQVIERIMLYKKQISSINEKIVPIVKEHYPNLLSIPGIGAVTIAGIVGEIGDVNNYHGSDSIVALAGLNPFVYESGTYKAAHTRITKSGSSYLRNALYLATLSMYMHKVEPIYSYVEKKKKEGKKHICALNHAARKLCNILFSLMKHKDEFKTIIK